MISIQLFTNIRKGVYGNFLNHKNYLRKCFILKSNIRYYSIDINDKLEYEKSILHTNNNKLFNKCMHCTIPGIILCKSCNGCGKIYFDGIKETICDKCNRSGYVLCNYCGGYGRYDDIL